MAVRRAILLYDDECGLCRRGSRRLMRMARRGVVEREPLQSERGSELAREAGVSLEECRAAMQLVVLGDAGEVERVHAGPEAIAAALATRRGLGWLTRVARWPLVRPALAVAYRWVARHRLTVSRVLGWSGGGRGRAGDDGACDGEACGVKRR